MKKKKFVFILISFVLSCFSFNNVVVQAVIGDVITGESITGEATSGMAAMNITIIPTPPDLTILNPQNKTYLTNVSLLLNFSSLRAQAVWYNLDNTANTTITSFIYFNTSEGPHTLYLFANNSGGNITMKNAAFTVNLSLLSISYNNFKGAYKGNSTDFISYPYENISNLNSVTLENTLYGKILFNEAINLTDITGNVLNLDTNINISLNKIELNPIALQNLNKSATLFLHSLSFNNPRILRDGAVCPSTICAKNSYINGVLNFNVSHFTVYSAEETSGEAVTPSTTGGGGGGEIAKEVKNFSINENKIIVSLKSGETKLIYVNITNTGTKKLKFNLTSSHEISDFIIIRDKDFELKADESKLIALDFIAKEDVFPDLYIGKIIVSADELEKEVFIALEIESKAPLFDVIVEIPEKFLKIQPGDEIVVNIKLFEVTKIGQVDVDIEYSIVDKEDSVIISDSETIAVNRQANFVKSLQIPKDTKEGNYLFYVRIDYSGKTASGSEWFKVKKITRFRSKISIYFMLIVLLVVILIILYNIIRLKKVLKK